MELDQLMHLSVAELSGGQAQRVAIARALLSSHKLLLMDEPVSALDPAARARVLNCLQRVHRDLKTPVIYVSHNLEEITNLSDRIAIMADGQILEQGPTMDMCSRPELAMAQEEHAAAILGATVLNHDKDYMLTEVSTGAGCLYLALGDHNIGDTVRIRIPARDVSVVLERPENTSILNVLHSKIEHLQDSGDGRVLLRLAHDKQHFLARLTRKSVENLGLVEGLMVYAQIKSVALLTESVIQVSESTDDR
jgi:molybdate transport system ATP-binding protein